MSYGRQLNIFRAKSNKYGRDWKGIVCCRDAQEVKIASEDAIAFLGGTYNRSTQIQTLPNGAQLYFRTVTCRMEADRAFMGREFTQIVWTHVPKDQYAIDMSRARLRSKAVPSDDWRYEYCTMP